jgi:hypothetical protein
MKAVEFVKKIAALLQDKDDHVQYAAIRFIEELVKYGEFSSYIALISECLYKSR